MSEDRKIIGEPSGWKPDSEADHYCICPGCGALVDMRGLAMALRHAGELPHGKGVEKS